MTLTRAPQLAGFRDRCSAASGTDLTDPARLYEFSVTQPELFWRELLHWSELPWSGSAEPVLEGTDVETARFFPDVRLNYAEALLRPLPGVDDDAPALTAVHTDRPAEHLGRRALRAAVERTAAALAADGVRVGDRVVAIAPNTAQVAVAALAVAALGATLSTATPDMGAAALRGRFEQVDPVVLLLDRTGMTDDTLRALVAGLPTLRRLLLLDDGALPADLPLPPQRLADLVSATDPGARVEWPRLPFDHPLFVMFSSGTTGPPKAMVHGAGGTLLEHVKEHRLHGDLRPEDTLYFHTTTAWMMWNWQLSALAVGAHVVVNDGPLLGPETLWELVAGHGVTVFGTSPAYLQLCQEQGYRPRDAVDLSRLRAVLSTGAVLHDWQFRWVADAVGDVPVQSISGGTDIIGCFVLGHPELPVRPGRCQSRSLGLDVAAVDADGAEVVGRIGELVCRRPFPSRPVGFLRDPDGSRFHAAYFADHSGMWTHGDLVDIDADGSTRMHGRSDGVLNIDGVRIGPSEIYTALRAVPEIADSMAVEQRDPGRPGQTRMVLLVVLRPGTELDGDLERTIRRTLRREASAAHVPALVRAVPGLPLTHNGKRSEAAARSAVNGEAARNRDALKNPDVLDAIRAAAASDAPVGGPAATAAPLRAPVVLGAVPGPADPEDVDRLLPELARLWSEVLGVSDIRPDDEFADIGGTSRQAMQLLRRVWLELGVDVPVSDLYERPTLYGVAEAIAARRLAGTERAPVLRPGTGRPLFVVTDLWGQLNSYHSLIQGLATERPVRGLQPELAAADGRRRTIAEVADAALVLLRDAQPSGPYSLAGYSFGGLVAYEVAVRLRAAGETVSYLGLIDVQPPTGSFTRGEARAQRAALLAKRLRTALSPAGPQALRTYLRENRDRSQDAEQLAFDRSAEVFDAHRLSPYDGPVTYYLAQRRLPFVGNTLGAWRRAAPHLLVTEVPGDHDDVLSGPGIEVLARRISVTLA
ncbi:acetoacetate--CoA ligase [Blastococcus sp. CCUG 61487]|uniref:acetoacetate--CoA ligase n=1 Tax=Blastococcus sp. CCUG 61487 TaxID=1840703 RepID=UPI0010C147FE|nr:acetoacetate--CoA ligase [Blastococcus sp. CCUG 61487]TKJ28112.1 acetoacetyl-CoA synthase [Blastococcus sp. CCUG 61487]